MSNRYAQTSIFLGIAILTMSFAVNCSERLAKYVYVNGYTRSDGTQVRGHYRSAPDYSYDNNWSTEGYTTPYTAQGNANTYTGERGTNERRGY